jgi:endonuclease/exonuclease/phosphatase (EEP) superfamily protein YafD
MRRTLSLWLPPFLLTIAVAVSIPLTLGFLNRWHPAFDSLSHFRLHLAGLLGLAALVLLVTRLRLEGLVALALAAGAFVVTPGTYASRLLESPAGASATPGDAATYRLLHFNARFDNSQPEVFLSLIARTRPDIVLVNEVSALWRERLGALTAAYPHRIVCQSRGVVGGVAILSRRPLVAGSEPECLDGGTLAVARVDLGGQPVDVAALHLYWPWPFEQPDQVARLAYRLSELPETALLAGDFNAVRWSETFRQIASAARMRDAGPVGPSWLPRHLPDPLRRLGGLGIDHVLAGSGIDPVSLDRLGDAGSDHLPVLTEFSVRSSDGGGEDSDSTRVVRESGPDRASPGLAVSPI